MSRDLQEHLTDDEFIGYALDDLPAELGQEIGKHVSSCEDCAHRLLAYYRNAEPELLSADAWQEKYGLLASRIQEGLLPILWARQQPAPGSGTSRPRLSERGLVDLALQTSYRTSKGNIVDAFYVPCLQRASVYKRAVGYFTSSVWPPPRKGWRRSLRETAQCD